VAAAAAAAAAAGKGAAAAAAGVARVDRISKSASSSRSFFVLPTSSVQYWLFAWNFFKSATQAGLGVQGPVLCSPCAGENNEQPEAVG
jgi:ABC-type sugar transport system substrate-binding protein